MGVICVTYQKENVSFGKVSDSLFCSQSRVFGKIFVIKLHEIQIKVVILQAHKNEKNRYIWKKYKDGSRKSEDQLP